MLSNFTLAFFTLTAILSASFGPATAQDYYSQDDTSVASTAAGQGDDYLASFLIANNSDSGASSQKKFKRNRVVRRMNTPAEGSEEPKQIVVPLHMSAQGPQYTGEIIVGRAKSYKVAFGTAAFDLAIVSSRSSHDKSNIRVNLFDGSGAGVVYQSTVSVGSISQESQSIIVLDKIDKFAEESMGQAKFGIFPLARTDYNFGQLPLLPSIKEGIEDRASTNKQATADQGTTKSFIKQAVENKLIEPVFAFALRQNTGRNPRGGQGELHLGKIKADFISKENGVEYHDCVANSPFWMIDKATITVGEYKIENVRTVFDTASRYVRGPEEEVSKIYGTIKETWSKKYKKTLTITREGNGRYMFFPQIRQNLPEITFRWGGGKQWKIPPTKFFQGGGAGLFAALTEFTANMKPPVMEPPLSMGPPGSESLKPHLKNVPQLPPVVNNRLLPEPKPQSGGMASDHKMHESAEVLQPGDWIIPYSVIEDIIYLILDGRNDGCKVGLTSLPPAKIES